MAEEQENRKYWAERLPNNEAAFCFRIGSHGRNVVKQFTLAEMAVFLEENAPALEVKNKIYKPNL